MKLILPLFLAAALSASGQVTTTTTPACSMMSLGSNGALNGFVPSPNDAWHQDISNAPIDPSSTTIINTSGDLAGSYLHPDFGSIAGGNYGIPYTIVDSSQTPLTSVAVTAYPAESDISLYPLTATTLIEGAPVSCSAVNGDQHALVIDRNTCVAYELYGASQCGTSWSAAQSTIWDFTTTEHRPYSYTSADAAGLSVFEGLIRYDEIAAGVINHAIRFTAQHTKNDAYNGYFTAPATHASGTLWGTDNIIGMRIRLKPGFDISGFSKANQVILKAMKQYGMILADNGSNLYFQGTPDARWDDSDLNALKAVPSSAFDVVKMDAVYDSATAPRGAPPTITSFTASASTVAAGTTVVLTPVVRDASYSYIDNAGFVRDSIKVTPTSTTTYTLTSRNAYGSTSASTTVTVNKDTVSPTLAFNAIPNVSFGTSPFQISATSNSSGSIVYAVTSGPALISGNSVTVTGAGVVQLTATQAAATPYLAATAAATFKIVKGIPTLSFVGLPETVKKGETFLLSAKSDSPAAISYSILKGSASISGNKVMVTGKGSVTVEATLAATANYKAAKAKAVIEP